MLKKWWKLKARVTTRVKLKLTMKVNLNLKRVKVTKTANRHSITTNKRKKPLKNIQLRVILSRKGSNSLFQTLVVTFFHLAEALMTQKMM